MDCLLNTALETGTQSDDDDADAEEGEPYMPRIAEVSPTVVIAAHNGIKYDFTMLLCECNRNKLPWQRMNGAVAVRRHAAYTRGHPNGSWWVQEAAVCLALLQWMRSWASSAPGTRRYYGAENSR